MILKMNHLFNWVLKIGKGMNQNNNILQDELSEFCYF